MEKITSSALSLATLGMPSGAQETGAIKGIYHAICRGYKQANETEYLSLFPRLQQLRADVSGKLAGTLAQLEAYMDSLCEDKWDQLAHNVVTDVGVNAMLDAALAGSSYTVAGPYMGLIGAASFSAAPAAGNTMASHAGWTEAGATNAPTYTAPRKTIAWNAASARAKAPSTAPVFAMTGTGTVKGVFLVFGSGALSTIDNTAGVLYSAGLFTGGDQPVVNTNTVTVTYSTSMT